jgi:hypothetical protein
LTPVSVVFSAGECFLDEDGVGISDCRERRAFKSGLGTTRSLLAEKDLSGSGGVSAEETDDDDV